MARQAPEGQTAWKYDYNNGEPKRLLTKDDFLDNVTLYWLTNSATPAARHSDRSANRGRQPSFGMAGDDACSAP